MKKIPFVINIIKRIKQNNDNLVISSLCFTNGIRIDNFDISLLKTELNGKEYPIQFKLKKGIPFIKKYHFNLYKIELPLKEVSNFDIQNKFIVKYPKADNGRIIYNLLDFYKGKNKVSKVITNNGKSMYLRQTIKNTMYLTVREYNEYDSFKGKLKILLGWALSKVLIKQKIILLYEKESSRYEESASVVYERLTDLGYNNVYYIINKDNPKIPSINEKYKKHFIYKNSLKHIMYFFKSKRFIGTESLGHAIQLRIANKLVSDKLLSKKNMYVFLQHGVMYMVSLSSDLRTGFRKQDIKLHKIVTSSKLEAKHFTDLGGFDINDLYICGLPKFDTAIRNKNADKIVIMPTWRRWEVNEASEDYTKTKYFKMIQRIVNAVPKTLKEKVVILPHPLMLNAIRQNENYGEFLPKGDFSYDDILKDCSILITDYSSISYDAFYRGANVIFCWKEKDECMKHYGENAFLMLNEKNAFGDICYSPKDVTKAINDNYMKNQVTKYKNRYKKIVEFDDNKNTDRLIEMLKEDGVI